MPFNGHFDNSNAISLKYLSISADNLAILRLTLVSLSFCNFSNSIKLILA